MGVFDTRESVQVASPPCPQTGYTTVDWLLTSLPYTYCKGRAIMDRDDLGKVSTVVAAFLYVGLMLTLVASLAAVIGRGLLRVMGFDKKNTPSSEEGEHE